MYVRDVVQTCKYLHIFANAIDRGDKLKSRKVFNQAVVPGMTVRLVGSKTGTLTQTTQAVTAAVNYLENIGTKPGSTRATIGMNELVNSAGGVFAHLTQASAQARQAVTDTTEFTVAAQAAAERAVEAATGAIASADGARARLEAELELARCEAILGEAKVAAKAAAAHQKASAPADIAEEAATEAQVKAEAKRDEADQARADGDEQITAAKTEAAAMIAAAEVRYDNAMTALEADMKVALGA